jgi:hypothetical protein
MSLEAFAHKAAATAGGKPHHLAEPLVVDREELRHPKKGSVVYCYRVVSAKRANGQAIDIFLDEHGKPAEPIPDWRVRSQATAAPGRLPGPFAGSGVATINPSINDFTINPGQTIDEVITVTIPANAGTAKADVYFLTDTTGSMGSILSAVQAGANTVLTNLAGLGIDIFFGVGNYKDFLSGDPYGFKHQVSLTNNAAAVIAGINAWSASGGADTPEADLFALNSLAEAPGGPIGWRSGSKRIIVWFGDAPGHDPVCKAASGAAADVTEASATPNLVAQKIIVLAISTANPGLNDDPKHGEYAYDGTCGPPGGTPGQATRITTATGGALATGINPGNIVNTIISLVKAAVGGYNNVNLVPSASITGFISSIDPLGGYGPLPGDKDQTLTFTVHWKGIPCTSTAQVVLGSLDVIADGNFLVGKRVRITVPPCAFTYSVKFVCGTQPECDCECTSVEPGRYATEINIHNYGVKDVDLLFRFIPVVLAGAPAGREPKTVVPRAVEKMMLPGQNATMIDCCRISELLFNGGAQGPVPLNIGFVEIVATGDIAVTAVYTTSGLKQDGVSIEVVQVAGKRQ